MIDVTQVLQKMAEAQASRDISAHNLREAARLTEEAQSMCPHPALKNKDVKNQLTVCAICDKHVARIIADSVKK